MDGRTLTALLFLATGLIGAAAVTRAPPPAGPSTALPGDQPARQHSTAGTPPGHDTPHVGQTRLSIYPFEHVLAVSAFFCTIVFALVWRTHTPYAALAPLAGGAGLWWVLRRAPLDAGAGTDPLVHREHQRAYLTARRRSKR